MLRAANCGDHAGLPSVQLTRALAGRLVSQKWELRVAVMHRDDMVEAAMVGDLERVDVQLQRDLPDINHVNKKVHCPQRSECIGTGSVRCCYVSP